MAMTRSKRKRPSIDSPLETDLARKTGAVKRQQTRNWSARQGGGDGDDDDDEVDESLLQCPQCPKLGQSPHAPGKGAAADGETWVCCSHCNTWFHCICIALENPDEYVKWYCNDCIDASEAALRKGQSLSKTLLRNVVRPPPRKSTRPKEQVDYAAIQEGIPADPVGRWNRFLQCKEFLPDRFKRMDGQDWTLDWLRTDPNAFNEPVLVPAPRPKRSSSSSSPNGKQTILPPFNSIPDPATSSRPLKPTSVNDFVVQQTAIPGMRIPPKNMTIWDVANIVGPETPVEVIDVATQTSSKAWTLESWAEYFVTPKHEKKKILNVISLEITGTDMEKLVEAPQLVRDMDWVTRDWPVDKRDAQAKENSWPKVQRYVLMGIEGAYSDWHIDFAGSSVYYHVVWGQKTFLFAPPTLKNLAAYRTWCSSTRQDFDWLGDYLTGLTRVDIMPGETMLIPSGWLHSVYTPKNTLVVGGNFLTDWNVATQCKLVEIEEQTKVPKKFRFPHFKRLSWYVAHGWYQRLSFLTSRGMDSDVCRPTRSSKASSSSDHDDDRNGKLSAFGDDGDDIDLDTLVERLPTSRVLEGISLVCQSLSDDLDLIQDPHLSQSQDEKLVKLQKAAKEAIPIHCVGTTQEARHMLEQLLAMVDRGLELAPDVEIERRRLQRKTTRSPTKREIPSP